ncbi:hypothetical protein [Rhodococcus rhodochrous]|nr:hypothetical protein [Rhodococcus rhodochrous]
MGDDRLEFPACGKSRQLFEDGMDTTLGAERPHPAEWRERGW